MALVGMVMKNHLQKSFTTTEQYWSGTNKPKCVFKSFLMSCYKTFILAVSIASLTHSLMSSVKRAKNWLQLQLRFCDRNAWAKKPFIF